MLNSSSIILAGKSAPQIQTPKIYITNLKFISWRLSVVLLEKKEKNLDKMKKNPFSTLQQFNNQLCCCRPLQPPVNLSSLFSLFCFVICWDLPCLIESLYFVEAVFNLLVLVDDAIARVSSRLISDLWLAPFSNILYYIFFIQYFMLYLIW